MKKELILAEVKEIFGEYCFETEASFGVNVYGKYMPNMTFIIPKEFYLKRDGKIMNPLSYVFDKEMTDNMNLDFDGKPSVIFGDYWKSKKGKDCFKPKDPMQAKHLLIRVEWGGCFNKHHGNWGRNLPEGILYFRRASSNGGGAGCDYWVVPVGFRNIIWDEEIDKNISPIARRPIDPRVGEYRKKHAEKMRREIEEEDRLLKEKLKAEEESRIAKQGILSRLTEIQAHLKELSKKQQSGHYYNVDCIQLGESSFELGCTKLLYSEEALAQAEARLVRETNRVEAGEQEWQEQTKAKAEFEPKFLTLMKRVDALGWRMETNDLKKAMLFEPYTRYYGWSGKCEDEHKYGFSYDEDGLEECLIMIIEQEEKIRKEREAKEAAERLAKAQAEAKALGLPSDIRLWHRSGRTRAGKAWVIMPDGMDRECDSVDTSICGSTSKKYFQSYEGNHVWDQIMPGEVVLYWSHAFTAAPHEFKIVYRPKDLTPAQLDRIAEIQDELDEVAKNCSYPPVGQGWGLFRRKGANISVMKEEEKSLDDPFSEGMSIGDILKAKLAEF